MRWLIFCACVLLLKVGRLHAATPAFVIGADISALLDNEKSGAVYRDAAGEAGDAIKILHEHGFNLFRVRLFVDPVTDPIRAGGATQDLAAVRTLGKRIKASGAEFLLDLHYADRWADPGKQPKPKAWEGLEFDALVTKVHDYTASVLKDLGEAGATPDMVQVGNEITNGMIWPDGKITKGSPEEEDRQWDKFRRLLVAGIAAVREASTAEHPIRVMIHVDSGGKPNRPTYFFDHLLRSPVDFDIIGLSAYPFWDDSLDALKSNMESLVTKWHKDIVVAETSYPWKPLQGREAQKATLKWPQTPEGQRQFVSDLSAVLRAAPEDRGRGWIWWFPEAVQIQGRRTYHGGAEALWDANSKPLPAMESSQAHPATATAPAH